MYVKPVSEICEADLRTPCAHPHKQAPTHATVQTPVLMLRAQAIARALYARATRFFSRWQPQARERQFTRQFDVEECGLDR
mgnify:CR=1 FL=1